MKRFLQASGVVATLSATVIYSTHTTPAAPAKKAAPTAKRAALARAKMPAVKPATAAAIKNLVRANRGKVVLVNFWATWCAPCQAEFPGLVKLQRKFAKQGLVVIFVSADDRVDVPSKVQPFLRRSGATGSYIVQGSLSDFIEQYEPGLETAFDFPRNYLYDRTGKQVEVFGEVDLKGAEAKVNAVL
jgi:thiol-disulfide isomerase/thioredoxin